MTTPQAKAAKEALEIAVTEFKQCKLLLQKAIDATYNERNLKTKLSSLSDALKKLNSLHATWIVKAGLDVTQLSQEQYNATWLETEWVTIDEMQTQVDALIEQNNPTPSDDTQLQILVDKLETFKLGVTSKTSTLLDKTSTTNKEIQSCTLKTYQEMLESVTSSLSGKYNELSQEIIKLDRANIASRCSETEKFRREQQNIINTITFQLAELIPITTTPSQPHNPVKTIEMEKSKAPSFSGRTIDYPEFKRAWQKVAGVVWEDGNQVEQIKLKVDSNTRLIISRCSSMQQVWQLLDEEYGQPEEVVNAVDVELKKLRMVECSLPEYIVKLKNHLPLLEESLKSVDGLDHLCSPARVSYLSSKFDERTMHDWDYFRSKHKSKGTYYELFYEFLVDQYDAAKSSIARSHRVQLEDSPNNHSVNRTAVTDAECRRCRTWTARDAVHTCPGCGRGTAISEKVHHCLEHCGAYMNMTPNERSKCVESAKWCPVHLLGTHSYDDCNMTNDPKYVCGVNGCAKHHHQSLHGSSTTFVAKVNVSQLDEPNANNVLFPIQSIPSSGGKMVNCMFDECATTSLITKKAAAELNLQGQPDILALTTVTGTQHIESFSYSLPLFDKTNKQHIIMVHDIDSIANNPKNDISGVQYLFSSSVQSVWDEISKRPVGEIDVLIGSNILGIHPCDLECEMNLRVKSSLFGSGFVLTGSHPSIKSDEIAWSKEVAAIRHSINHVKIKPNYDFITQDIVPPPRRCQNCQNCKDCSYRSHMLTQQEQYEYQVFESKIQYDSALESFVVSYPFTEDPSLLPNNKAQVIKIAQRTERKLLKDGMIEHFNTEFDKLLSIGALVEITESEMDSWDGPIHYVSLQPVINEDSPTTPLRIVTNSSLSDRNGLSVNSILMKGPKSLSDQWSVLTQWRAYEVGLLSDVTKAYYSLRTGPLEKHIRRVVWRHGDVNEKWKVFGFPTVSFGDKCASTFLEIAIKKTAAMNEEIDPVAAQRIKDDRYVDDFATGGTPTEVSRFVGNEGDDFQCDGTFPAILSKGSLKLKVLVTSGETDPNKLEKLGKKVLGLGYDATTDTITIDMKSALTVKNNKGVISFHDFSSIDHQLLTPRNLLSIVNGIYDPLGLIAPISIKLRVAFRALFQEDSPIEWDTPISSEATRSTWLSLIQLLSTGDEPSFGRSLKPLNTVGQCQLVCFFDGSDVAFAATVYIRWTLDDGSVHVSLVCAKSRVTPLHHISTPRSEMNGAVLLISLVYSVIQSLSSAKVIPERTWMIGDSECTLASLEKVNAAFGEYFGNRIGTILEQQAMIERVCPIGENGEWYHTESKNNAADLATRLDSTTRDIGSDSEWQCGPSFLKLPPSEWPISREFAKRKEDYIPQCELLKRYRGLINNTQIKPYPCINQLLDPECTNDWDYLLYKTQLLVFPFMKKKHDVTSFQEVAVIEAAKRQWFLSAMPETVAAKKAGRLKELDVREIDDMYVVCGRASTGLQKFFGKNYLPVIMGTTRVAYLIMLNAHCKDHTGRDITMAMSRKEAWIVNAKKLAKKIVHNCLRCRFLRHKLEQQKMASIPASIQGQFPPWTNIGLDLTGPITVKAMTNKRSTMKVWVVIFLCLNTKAVSMEISAGYSTKDFLLAYNAHVNVRGTPKFVHSDRGSQLVSAHKDVAEELLKYDWDFIASSTAHNGTTWKFAPAGGQWRNGAAESFVKKFKLSFTHLYQDSNLNFAELSCAVKRIANVLNHRPVSVQRTKSDAHDDDFLAPLTPNMLITGRSSDTAPRDCLNFTDDPHMRKSFLDELEQAWWFQFKVQYFDSLIPTRKWIDSSRNVAVGDVVLLQYASKSTPGTYRLGRVTAVETDEDGLVRTCTVRYSLVKAVTKDNRNTVDDVTRKEVRVAVQRLVMILPVEEQ